MPIIRFIVIALAAVAAGGCAVGYEKFHSDISGHVAAGRCESLDELLKEKGKVRDFEGSNERLLYLLDSAAALMACGDYEASNLYYHKAERYAEELWTKSATKEAAALVLSDYARPYGGEDFERALINLFSAVNYVMLGETDEALVEVRRLDSLLKMFNSEYEGKNIYDEDAFGRYLSGIIYDSTGAVFDAFIDYSKAVEAYRAYDLNYGTETPAFVVEDYLRAAEAAGRMSEAKRVLDKFTGVKWRSGAEVRSLGRVVFIMLDGNVPVKVSDRVMIATKHGPVTFAFPRLESPGRACGRTRLYLESNGSRYESEVPLVEDVGAIAVKNLADRKGRVIARELVRVALKQAAGKAAAKKLGDTKEEEEAIRALFNILDSAIAQADTRSWRTLPEKIYLSRVFLPKGRYEASVAACGGARKRVGAYEVKTGGTTFILYRNYGPR